MKSNPRVLFVGHDAADASLLELVLARDLPAAEVVHTGDPVSFGREIERGRFDLIVCDERLDWTDGTAVLLELGSRSPAVPLVILSEHTLEHRPGADRNLRATRLKKSSASFLKLPQLLSAALQRAADEQRQAHIEPRIRSLLQRSRVGVFRCTLAGELLDADETLLTILGARSLEEAQQLDLTVLTPQLPRGFTETGKLYRRKQSLSGVDGRLIRVALTELVTLDGRGMPVLDGLLEDLAEPGTAQARPGREASESTEDTRRFSSLLAHELKEPLRTIEQSTRMMLEDSEGKLGKEAEESAELVVTGVRRVQSLIEGLLTLARAGGEEESAKSCDCNDLVNEVLETLRGSVEETQAAVTVNALPTVQADPNQLRLLFRNLISNAIKFHGGKPPSIEIAARQDGEDWIFSVQDDGIGIEPAATERIFERFVRNGEAAGSGLGLAICKEVVEHHGGRIWAESGPGQGATFYFTLPLFSARRGDAGNEPLKTHAKLEGPSSSAHEGTG